MKVNKKEISAFIKAFLPVTILIITFYGGLILMCVLEKKQKNKNAEHKEQQLINSIDSIIEINLK